MKTFLLLFGAMTIVNGAIACDICGCGMGSYYSGILPEFSKHIIGIRYRHNSLTTHLGRGGAATYLTTKEIFHTTEVWGGWTLNKRWRLMGNIPYNFNRKSNRDAVTSRSGMGDIHFQSYYLLLDKKNDKGKKIVLQTLWLGGGIKLPTGKYDAAQKDNSGQSANTFQLGTGTTDFTVNTMYDLRIQDFGINSTASYKINTTNSEEYRYGNRLSATVQSYYKIRFRNTITFAPNAGLIYETADRDRDSRFVVDASGGAIVLGGTGLELTSGKVAAGTSWQFPIRQDLALGQVKANSRLMMHISFML